MCVPCRSRRVKADNLEPNHLRTAASAFGAILGRFDNASSSSGSPLPAVLAMLCHFRASILSAGVPFVSAREAVLGDRVVLPGRLAQNSATAAASFFGVPVPL